MAPAMRYTENGQELACGDGLWGTADALGVYRHDIADTTSGQIASFSTISEGETRSILVTRLKLGPDGITEVECLIARPDPMGGADPFPNGPANLDAMGAPDPSWFEPIPAGQRLPRDELCRIANLYFAGLEKNDGKGVYPFAEDCVRIENGSRTTAEPGTKRTPENRDPETPYQPDFKAMNAREQFETGFFAFVDRIRDRRFVIVDEEIGVVFAFAFFDHSGTVRQYELADGTQVSSRLTRPFSWHIGEAFRIEDGLFTRIEAVMTDCPYGMQHGWS